MFFFKKFLGKKYTKKQLKRISYGLIGSFVLIYLLISYLLVFRPYLNKSNLFFGRTKICYKTNCFDVKIAKTKKQREKGLMFVEYLPIKSGMLFVFDKMGNYSFRMKNTKIPLDILWLNKDYKVVDIKTAKPCFVITGSSKLFSSGSEKNFQQKCLSYISNLKSKFVLEINAGLADKLGIKVGDYLKINKIDF